MHSHAAKAGGVGEHDDDCPAERFSDSVSTPQRLYSDGQCTSHAILCPHVVPTVCAGYYGGSSSCADQPSLQTCAQTVQGSHPST